jgi:hypothetical protein
MEKEAKEEKEELLVEKEWIRRRTGECRCGPWSKSGIT